MSKIVFVRNGLTSGGLGMMSAIQANYFYERGFDVTVLVDQSYSEELLNSKNAKMYNAGIKIIPALTSELYYHEAPKVKRKALKEQWFGGTITSYYDEYGILVKKAYHDINKQRVKIEIPIIENYLNDLKTGDVVITMEASLGWYVGNLKLKNGISTIHQIHNQHFFLSDWIDIADKYTSLMCQTQKTADAYEKLYGKKNNIKIIPNPLRIEIPNDIIPHNKRKIKLVFVGRLEEGKQVSHAIKAFDKVKKEIPNVIFEIYGTGKEKESLEKLVKDMGLENSVHFKGHESNLSKIFSDASLMIFPSKRESFGMVILEAFAYGVPVVAYSTVFGVDDLINDGEDGYIVTQGDIDEMANKTISLLKDVNLRDKLAKKAHSKVYDYQYDLVMKKYFEYIIEVSRIKIDEKSLLLNKLYRFKLPQPLFNEILSKIDEPNELENIIDILNNAKVKIIKGQAYIYSDALLKNYNIPLKVCDVNG